MDIHQESATNHAKYQSQPAKVCDLQSVDFSRLLSQEPEEVDKLLRCCKEIGFFYLDLRGIDGRMMLEYEKKLLQVMLRFFSATAVEKNEIGLPCQAHGFEPVGTHAGVVENTMDGYEILKVSRDEVSAGSPVLPSIIKKDIPVFEEFIASSNIITKTMLACLSNALNLKGADRFEASHRNDHKSNTTLAMFRYVPTNLSENCVGHQKHTDIGSLTLLFSEQWGLQVMSPGTTSWEFVAPRPGHAVINVGDSLRFASGHVLQSCIHQVVPMDVAEDRYSIAYFLRPESEKKYKDSKGRWISASQWHDEKYEVFKRPHVEQVRDSILTGGMESGTKVA